VAVRPAAAEDRAAPAGWSGGGEIGIDTRLFSDDGDPATQDGGAALFSRLELRHQHGLLEEKGRIYGLADYFDRDRSLVVLQEAWVQVQTDRLRLREGMDIVSWTALEMFHPADVVNAHVVDSDVESPEKIGEPIASLQVRLGEGTTLSAMYLPHRTMPAFASPRSRVSLMPGVDVATAARAVDGDGHLTDSDWASQGALVLRQVLGSADVSVHAIELLDRLQPSLRIDLASGAPLLIYQTVRQLGATYQQALGPVVLKAEGVYRWFVAPAEPLPGVSPLGRDGQPDHGILAAGAEYGIAHAGGAESTFLVEGQAVIGVGDAAVRDGLTPFPRDLFVGYRGALNDERGRTVQVGGVLGLERRWEGMATASYEQRLDDSWSVRAALRLFFSPDGAPGGQLAALRRADHVRLMLVRHF
jgi:hypothetical protein